MKQVDNGIGRARRGLVSTLPKLAAIALAVALLAGWALQSAFHGRQEREQGRAELYWNGYTKLYFELGGDWEGLQERLDQDAYMYAGERSLNVKIYERSGGVQPVAEVSRGGGSRDGGRRLPVLLLNGDIVGYTETRLKSDAGQKYWLFGIAGAIAALITGAGILLARKFEAADERAGSRLAAELSAYIRAAQSDCTTGKSGRDGAANAEREWKDLPSLKREIAELLKRNHQLETVRRTMVADIAHELRTPIAIMRTALDHALQSGESLEPARLAGLHDETLRLSRLVRELQELSLAESGHLPLFKTWFPLSELAEEVLETLSAEGEERGIRYRLTGFGDARMFGDRNRVRQMLINLVGNAFRHARGMVTVSIELQGGRLELEVADDGLGIEEEELDRVFDRFYRGGESRRSARERGTGLGLGLAIVREFARAHGGDAAARSRYGEGASFIVTLPVMKE